jgi:hypothetical protein
MGDFTKYIYDKVRSRYGNDEQADQFMQGMMTKLAAATAAPDIPSGDRGSKPGISFESSFTKGIGESAGRAVAGGIAAVGIAGIAAIASQFKDKALYRKFLQALNEATQTNRVLKGADKNKLMNFAHTIFKFAPHVATDPNLLSTILSNAIHGESIDPMTVKTLTELENRYRDVTGFDPKRWT